MGGNISEKIDLYEFMETGRGVIANKQVYNFEKIIIIPTKLIVNAPYILEQCPGTQVITHSEWVIWKNDSYLN